MSSNKNLLDSCLYQLFLKYQNHLDFLKDIDFKEYTSYWKPYEYNFFDYCIHFQADGGFDLDIRKEFESIVLLPIIKWIFKLKKVSTLNHSSLPNRDPRYKTINSLLMYNYFFTYKYALEHDTDTILIHFHVIVWLVLKLFKYASRKKIILELIELVRKRMGKIKDPKIVKYFGILIDIGNNPQIYKKAFEKEIQENVRLHQMNKDDHNEAMNQFIFGNYLGFFTFEDFYTFDYEEDYNIIDECIKYKSLIRQLAIQPIKMISDNSLVTKDVLIFLK